MCNIKFSIAIPAYKSKFLAKAIESCLRQTYANFELIVVDDCSPEKLEDIVSLYDDSRIRFFRNSQNCGAECVVDNWNICLSYCCGEWIICMGDDDMLMPNCLEKYAEAIDKYPSLDEFHARTRLIDENDLLLKILPDRADCESAYANIIHRMEGRQQYIGDFCYRIRRLREIGGFYKLPFAWGSDDITAYMCGCPNGVGNINEPTFCYRVNRYTISNSGNEEKKLKALMLVDKWIEDFTLTQNPMTELQKFEINQIIRLRPKALSNMQSFVIENSIRRNGMNVLKWLLVRRKYALSVKTVIKTTLRIFVKK